MSTPDPNNPYAQNPYQQNNPYGQQAPQGVPPQGQPGYGYPQQPPAPAGQPGYGYPQQPGQGGPMGGGMPMQGGPMAGGPNIASMGQRFAARLLDGLILGVIGMIASFAGVGSMLGAAEDCDPSSAGYDQCMNDAAAGMLGTLLPIMLLYGILTLLYEVLMVGLKGATLGKMIMNLRVAKAETGQNPGIGGSFLRWIIPTVGSFLCGIGQLLVYLSPFWDGSGRRQGWHDKVAGTLVVRTK